ncbi:PAS domain-containing protein [Chitinophaga sp. S165]|uniref:PAS domain-containing sensor histidine kinase n=1 Tax=Chitinophaga sp. S165 TaxID=2135462 RepID=UPI000D71B9A4|nr:PAS domain-containing protein [Chitinophaga sp. S165]PWV56629.1 PAS domain S-box-containing protein [Chitinophaga sp. S165]
MEQKHNNEARPVERYREDDQEWMRFALRSAGLGTWDMDPINRCIVYDDRCRELYGFPEGDVMSYESLLTYAHPEDKPMVATAMERALANENGGRYDFEFRVTAADNRLRWLRCIGQAYFNEAGVAYRFAGTIQDVSRQSKSREKKVMLFSLVESSSDFIAAADYEGRIFYMNSSGRKLLGIPQDLDITLLGEVDLYNPDYHDFIAKEVLPQLRTGHKWTGTVYLRHYDSKEIIPFHADFSIIKDPRNNSFIGHGAALRDLRPELEAKKEQQKLLALLENSRDFVSLSDEAGNVSYVNAAGQKLLGLDSLMDARRHNSEYLMPGEIDRLKNEINVELFNRGQWSGEIQYRHFKTGEAIPVFGTTMLVYDPLTGVSQGRASIARDLREEKALRQRMIDNEQELERLVELRTDELKKANIDLNIVNQNLEQFAYVASHDLQEPLRKINMFSALMQDKYANELNETGVRNLGIIRNAATRMTTLIQDLLAFSRVSRQDHLFERIDLVQVMEQVLTDLEVLIQQKNATINYDSLCCIKGIPLHMTQLFQNLLSNALKFSKADVAPVIRITSRMMEPEEVGANPQLQNGTTYCEIKVQDNGIGFDPTYARKIFVIFQRLHGRGEYEGSGIGLALCQKIVTAHHGVIYAESEEKQGAAFTVILPAYT